MSAWVSQKCAGRQIGHSELPLGAKEIVNVCGFSPVMDQHPIWGIFLPHVQCSWNTLWISKRDGGGWSTTTSPCSTLWGLLKRSLESPYPPSTPHTAAASTRPLVSCHLAEGTEASMPISWSVYLLSCTRLYCLKRFCICTLRGPALQHGPEETS